MDQRQCLCCRIRFIPLRNAHQRYCSKSACQKRRRRNYQKQKLKRDIDYKETHSLSQQKWRHKHPDYWRQYRIQHPTYVIANRHDQAIRNQRRRDKQKNARHFLIANMYSFLPKNEYFSNCYKVFLCKKSDCKYVPYRQEDSPLLL